MGTTTAPQTTTTNDNHTTNSVYAFYYSGNQEKLSHAFGNSLFVVPSANSESSSDNIKTTVLISKNSNKKYTIDLENLDFTVSDEEVLCIGQIGANDNEISQLNTITSQFNNTTIPEIKKEKTTTLTAIHNELVVLSDTDYTNEENATKSLSEIHNSISMPPTIAKEVEELANCSLSDLILEAAVND